MVGRRWSKFVATVGVVVTISLGVAVPAGAEGEPDTGAFNAFVVKASNGYTMRVLAFSEDDYRKGEVLILLSREDSAVAYFSPATVTDTKIDADLGELGRISLEFVPSGRKKRLHTNCDSGPTAFDGGSYVGTLEFSGEEGFTHVSATQIPFTPRPLVELVCGMGSEGEGVGPGLPGVRLRAIAGRGRNKVSLQVNQNRPEARVRVEAAIEERRGSLWVAREVERTYPAAAFHFDSRLRSAVLRPPAPFSGSAVYRRDADAPDRWTGSLAVDFPGDSNVALAGVRFQSNLIRAHLDKSGFRYAARPNLPMSLLLGPS